MSFHYSTFTPKKERKNIKHQKLVLHIIIKKDEIIMEYFL